MIRLNFVIQSQISLIIFPLQTQTCIFFFRSSSNMYLKVPICLLLIVLGTFAVQGQGKQLRPDSEPLHEF